MSETRAKEVQELLAPAVEKLSKVMGIPAETLKQEVMPKVEENAEDYNNNAYNQVNIPKINNIIDWTTKFNGKETTDLTKVREYINKVIKNGNKFATSNPDWFIDIKKENSKRKQKRITNKLANEQNYQNLDEYGKIRHNKYIIELEELIKNAEYAPPPKKVKESKKNRKSFIEKYHYFKVNIKVGKNVYEIILDTEQYKGESENKPQTVHLYNIQEKSSGTYADNAYLKIPDDNNIITNNSENFNPSENKGAYSPKENLIEFFKNADSSTSVHEVGHWLLNT